MKSSSNHTGRSSLNKFKIYYEDLPAEELSRKFRSSEEQHRK